MGKRKGQINKMGRSMLVKDLSKRHGHRPNTSDSFLHTTELDDGTTYNRINFQSVTEQNNLEDFLTTAEMSGKDFTAERLNVQVITQPADGVRLTRADLQKISQAQNANRALLQIPRRPKWDQNTTKENLAMMERDSFTDWRRQLKLLQEKDHIQLTPYEKNLDFWRQLWRVIERSDVIVQIVDARNPLLFRCEDLEFYVREVDPMKTVMLLINKADFLTQEQRQQWVEHFNLVGLRVVFFSAKVERQNQEGVCDTTHSDDEDEEESDDDDDDVECNSDDDEGSENEDEDKDELSCDADDKVNTFDKNETKACDDNSIFSERTAANLDSKNASSHEANVSTPDPDLSFNNSPEIVNAEELLDIFRKLAHPASQARSDGVKTVGMVGYPNVGKSSTINVILQEKKLAVSATPGRTKHLQTLFVDDHLMLCDCPGLVFPSFVTTKAHLVINGVLPIDEMRDHVSPTNLSPSPLRRTFAGFRESNGKLLTYNAKRITIQSIGLESDKQRSEKVCERIPRNVLESTYSIMIPRPSLDDDTPDRIPTAEELLNAYGGMRGFMTARGTPDGPRSSRYILKDFVQGKLLYCEPPPGVDGAEFQDKERVAVLERAAPVSKIAHPQIRSAIDKEFFAKKDSKIHIRGDSSLSEIVGASTHQPSSRTPGVEASGTGFRGSMSSVSGLPANKPWKKHNNKNKKEKLRRLHRDLDV